MAEKTTSLCLAFLIHIKEIIIVSSSGIACKSNELRAQNGAAHSNEQDVEVCCDNGDEEEHGGGRYPAPVLVETALPLPRQPAAVCPTRGMLCPQLRARLLGLQILRLHRRSRIEPHLYLRLYGGGGGGRV